MSSISWRFQHDSAHFLYFAYAMDQWGMIPYKDILEVQMPGTFWVYTVIGRFSDYQDIGFRVYDLVLLGIISAITLLWQRNLSYKIAWSGAVLFGITYLSAGPYESLQREYIALVPILGGIYLSSVAGLQSSIRYYLVGLLFGLSSTIKPQMMIGLAPVIVMELMSPFNQIKVGSFGRRFFSVILSATVGIFTPVSLMFLWLYRQGNLQALLDIVFNYWPLYLQLNGSHECLVGVERIKYVYSSYRLLGGYGFWLIPASIGFFVAINSSRLSNEQKHQIMLLGLLTICYSAYAVVAGTFLSYHWIPFVYFVIQLSSLCMLAESSPHNPIKRILPLGVLLFVVLLMIPPALPKTINYLTGDKLPPPKSGIVDELANYLKNNLGPLDTVQPLDWTGGAIHAMLLSKAKLATRFPYDFQFYHHTSNPYIKELRREFVFQLHERRPRFIIEILDPYHPRPQGYDTTREFPELRHILDNDYRTVFQGTGFVVYELFPNSIGAVIK
jgi:hypothetical protein